MKKFFLMTLLVMTALCVGAVPAKRGITQVITLTDGTTLSATLVGDEFGHYWLGNDGNAYQVVPESAFFRQIDRQQARQRANARRMKANQRRMARMAPRKVGTVGSYTGAKKALIILVNFSDKTFKSTDNLALYKRIANEKNFSYGSFKGSMYDYFYAQSQGQFQLTFDVVGPVAVSKPYSYYGGNDSDGNDKHPAEMVIEAVKEVVSTYNLDFSQYDWDGDGEVDQVYLVYAGYGEADSSDAKSIWPHAFDLSSANYWGDGSGPVSVGNNIVVNTYACGGELNGQTSSIAGIGTMCHEFSHCLGYPDFYDTDYSGGQGMGAWDLMCDGSYNGDGYQPAGYTSYERWVAGWHEPTILSQEQAVQGMKSLQEGGESYIIYNDNNRNEYYLLENRQFTGWDASLPGKGLLILHVDYDATAWNSNTPNDEASHQRMTWVAADNQYQYYTSSGTKFFTEAGQATDTYPYGANNSFSKNSTPAAKFYNKTANGTYYMDFVVSAITQNSDGTITFNYSPDGNTSGGDDTGQQGQLQGTGKYKLVTSTSELVSGKNYLIVSTRTDGSYVAYNGLSTDKGLVGTVNPVDGVIDLNLTGNVAIPVQLNCESTTAYGSYWSIKDDEIYLTALSKNKLGKATSYSLGNTAWTITVSNGVAKVRNYNNDAYFYYNATADMFRTYTSKQRDIALYMEIEEAAPATVTVTVGQYGTLSFSSDQPLDFTQTDLQAYYITQKRGSYFVRQQVEVVPANTGIIVVGEQGEYQVPVAVPTPTMSIPEQLEGNMLVATSTGEFTVGSLYGRVYSLFYSFKTGIIGFQKKKADYTFPANKCYLLVPESQAAGLPDSFFEDEELMVDGIRQVATDTPTTPAHTRSYNLNGQQVSPSYHGIIITNGKKYLRR